MLFMPDVYCFNCQATKSCCPTYLAGLNVMKPCPGSRYFCESFYGHPCPTSGKSYATANACGCPSRPASFVGYPARGIQHHSRNDSTQKALRENTCAIASGDYSTPVSQRGLTSNQGFTMLYPTTVLYIFI